MQNSYKIIRFQLITNAYNYLKSVDTMKKAYLLGISLFVVGYLNAQESKFLTKKIEDIASYIPQAYFEDQDTIIFCPEICQSKSIVVQYNDKHQVSHIGISLFSKETKEIINEPVCNFIERFLLELVLAKDKNSITDIINKSKITLQQNGSDFGTRYVNSIDAILGEIKESALFTLNLNKNPMLYAAVWNYGDGETFSLRFPANRELIFGTNKKESDGILYDQLRDNQCSGSIIQDNVDADFLTLDDKGSIYIRKGETFMIPLINADTYYKKINDGYELIYDEKYPTESLSNLIEGYSNNKNLKLHIKHLMYGNFSPEFEMKLTDFLCFFKKDFNIYTASYQKENGELKSTVVFQNKQMNYIHLLLINASESSIFNNDGVMTASFYSNIPQQSIKNLIGDLTNNNN